MHVGVFGRAWPGLNTQVKHLMLETTAFAAV